MEFFREYFGNSRGIGAAQGSNVETSGKIRSGGAHQGHELYIYYYYYLYVCFPPWNIGKIPCSDRMIFCQSLAHKRYRANKKVKIFMTKKMPTISLKLSPWASYTVKGPRKRNKTPLTARKKEYEGASTWRGVGVECARKRNSPAPTHCPLSDIVETIVCTPLMQ